MNPQQEINARPKKVVSFGEPLLRLSPPGYLRLSQAESFEAHFGGGAESNVAASLAYFGLNSYLVSRIPQNEIADRVMAELRGLGVDTQHVLRGGERLGSYYLETGAVQRGSKVVYDRAYSGMATIQKGMIDWDEVFKGADWFHWSGITPALSQGAADVCLEAIEAANRVGVPVSVDPNYRDTLWKYGKNPSEVMPALVADCDVVLGSGFDAEECYGLPPVNGHEAAVSALQQIEEAFPGAKKIITTVRGSVSASHNSWEGMLWDGKELYESPTYQITDIVDRVGGGDSFMAGLIYGLLTYESDQDALNFAVAASALKHTIEGDVNLVTIEEVEKLMEAPSPVVSDLPLPSGKPLASPDVVPVGTDLNNNNKPASSVAG